MELRNEIWCSVVLKVNFLNVFGGIYILKYRYRKKKIMMLLMSRKRFIEVKIFFKLKKFFNSID